MSRKAQIQAKADFEARNEEAWKAFDARQAIREAEIRRPARKIDVISDEEIHQKGNINYFHSQYVYLFLRGMKLRDLRFHKEFADFFTESFTLNSNDQKQAASEAATCISNSMSLYCQAHSDPYYILDKKEGYKGLQIPGLPNKTRRNAPDFPNFILMGHLESYLKLEGGFLSGDGNDPSGNGDGLFAVTMPAAQAIESRVGSFHWLRKMKQC